MARQLLTEIYRGALAGVQYSDYQLAKLKAGTALKLVWEKTNAFDPNAIAVYAGKVKIGYINKESTHVLHGYRKSNIKLTAKVSAFNNTNPTWSMIAVAIYCKNKKDINETL